MIVSPYMVPIYELLVKAGALEIDSLSDQYQISVAEYLAGMLKQGNKPEILPKLLTFVNIRYVKSII